MKDMDNENVGGGAGGSSPQGNVTGEEQTAKPKLIRGKASFGARFNSFVGMSWGALWRLLVVIAVLKIFRIGIGDVLWSMFWPIMGIAVLAAAVTAFVKGCTLDFFPLMALFKGEKVIVDIAEKYDRSIKPYWQLPVAEAKSTKAYDSYFSAMAGRPMWNIDDSKGLFYIKPEKNPLALANTYSFKKVYPANVHPEELDKWGKEHGLRRANSPEEGIRHVWCAVRSSMSKGLYRPDITPTHQVESHGGNHVNGVYVPANGEGVPGFGLGTSDFGEERISAGQSGEQQFADFLDATIPGTKFRYSDVYRSYWSVRGLNDKGLPMRADIDCVLVTAPTRNRTDIWLVDVKKYAGGNGTKYHQYGPANAVMTNGDTFYAKGEEYSPVIELSSNMGYQLTNMRNLVANAKRYNPGVKINVFAAVVFVSADDGTPHPEGLKWPGDIPAMTADEFLSMLDSTYAQTGTRLPNMSEAVCRYFASRVKFSDEPQSGFTSRDRVNQVKAAHKLSDTIPDRAM